MKNAIGYNSGVCKFSGKWQENRNGEIVSYGAVATVEIGFTGNKIGVLCSDEEKTVLLDGKSTEPEYYEKGIYLKTDNGRHTLKIISHPGNHIKLKGFCISEDEEFFRTADRKYIHFIGDSITYNSTPGFPSVTAGITDADYSVEAFCGMSLVDGWGWYEIPKGLSKRPGMESMYFKLEHPDEAVTYTDYRFEYCRQPDVTVIFLGTNDYISNKEDKEKGNLEIFARAFLRFCKKISEKYPESEIVIMNATSDPGCRREAITLAFERIIKSGINAHLTPTEKWDIEISEDGTHPTVCGYKQIAENLANYLSRVINL